MVAAPTIDDRTIGRNLRFLRQSRRLTQERLAQAIGVTYQQIYKYETGVSAIPGARLHALSMVLKVPHSYFFESLAPQLPVTEVYKISPEIMRRALKLQQITEHAEQRKILKIIDILMS